MEEPSESTRRKAQGKNVQGGAGKASFEGRGTAKSTFVLTVIFFINSLNFLEYGKVKWYFKNRRNSTGNDLL